MVTMMTPTRTQRTPSAKSSAAAFAGAGPLRRSRGRSARSVSSSPSVRAAKARPLRSSSSSVVSLPATAWSRKLPATRSRSASEARTDPLRTAGSYGLDPAISSDREVRAAPRARCQVRPSLPRPDVGDIRRAEPVRLARVEVALDQVRRGADTLYADRRLGAPAPELPRQARAAHQALDALAPHAHVVLRAQLGVHARRPVGLQRVGVDLRDASGQRLVGDRPRRRLAPLPGVKPRSG